MSAVNPSSHTWAVVRERIDELMADARRQLEAADCTPARADQQRGAINALKALLRLADDEPAIPRSEDHYDK